MTNELPSNVGYGTVTGRFLLAYSDSADGDLYPDGAPAKGSVLFTPSPNFVKNVTASPAPVTILPATISCDLDSEGYLLGYTGSRGVRLVATDDADNNPIDWTWKVTFRLTDADGTPTRGIPDFSFELPQGTTVDLTSVMPMPDSSGTFYLTGPTGETGPANTLSIGTVTTGSAGSSASASIAGSAPNQTLSLTIPRGVQGIQGIQGIQGLKGDKGDQGEQGIQGIQGIQGVQGIQGETGAVGPTGATGITWKGAWSNTVDYINNDAVFYNNASWFASGNPTVGEVPSESATHWYPLALQGATGATGPQGIQGIQGETGPQGPAGNLGDLAGTLPITYIGSTIGFDPTHISFIDGGTA